MLNQPTLDKMQAMKLYGMADALAQQFECAEHNSLSFEERLGLLIDAEWIARENRKLTRRLRMAKLRYPASLEDVNFKARRNLDRQQFLALGSCTWISQHHNLILTGPTGIGKSYLACALVERITS